MINARNISLLETAILAFLGGSFFNFANLPLPWVLGPLVFVMLWQGFTKREMVISGYVKNGGFIILGISFGLYFTVETFQTIFPYMVPYLFLTCVLILMSILLGLVVAKWIAVDKITSVFSCIPGGLSEMAIASESLRANSALVVIFQTIRLLTVLFTIPTAMTFLFADSVEPVTDILVAETKTSGVWNYLWFIFPIILAIRIRNKIPAGILIGALAVTAVMNVSTINLPQIPDALFIAAQIAVGTSLGKNILFRHLKLGGKYSFVYFGISIILILTAVGLGVVLASFSTLNYATAILSIAPGGLFEMVLTASSVGGDPAVVSALQLMRILLIVLCVPPLLGWYFR
ncbi:AbrB family transcriptional regulator [Virgibacillus byunsanensis]|uniref:AbrB family transcriptional regulator n=1 Tax=Virgibacillus byunsanensis TaxID=570945 RepID=A0ABW3LJ07_9BACI